MSPSRTGLFFLFALLFARRGNPHHAMIVAIQGVSSIPNLAAFVFHSNRKSFISATTLDTQGQISFQIRTTIGSVMILIVLFVTKHINPIEIRLVQFVWLFR